MSRGPRRQGEPSRGAQSESRGRRALLQLLGAAAAAAALPGALAAAPTRKLRAVGLQLYTVRKALETDFDGTLARVGSIGYREVEFAGYFGHSPSEVRASLDRAHLSAPSAHVSLDTVTSGWERAIAAAHEIGHRYLVLAAISELASSDDYRRLAERLNRAGEIAARSGIRVGYHNHVLEFKTVDGRLPYDILLESTDPKLVCFEMDLYWIVKAGQDPEGYFARWPGRIELVHVKDGAGPDRVMTDVGAGSIDFAHLFAANSSIRHYFVERDEAPDPFASITASYRYLEKLRY